MFHSLRLTPQLDKSTWDAAVDFAITGSLFPESKLHGEDHWRAVATQGLRLADQQGLGPTARAAAALFGLFHDCRRLNDDWDPEHGRRGAEACLEFLSDQRFPKGLIETLAESMVLHDGGQTTDNPLMGLGWDADRSVLTRVGITPSYAFFSVVRPEDFDGFVESGYAATRTPLSWDEIHAAAFTRKS